MKKCVPGALRPELTSVFEEYAGGHGGPEQSKTGEKDKKRGRRGRQWQIRCGLPDLTLV